MADKPNQTKPNLCEFFSLANTGGLSNSKSPQISPASIIIIIIVTPWEFFTSALADGLSQEFEWYQVSSNIQEYYHYYYYYSYSLMVFHISVSWWSFTGVWMTAISSCLQEDYYYYHYSYSLSIFHISISW